MSEGVSVVRHERVWLARWDRPAKRNAITAAMYARMAEVLAEFERDAAAQVLVLAGRGGHFTAGNDVGDFLRAPPAGDAPVLRFLRALAAAPKPVLAAVNGVAVGVGTTMLLHCDLVYAAEDARFAMPFVPLGLCPEAASTLLLPRLAGPQQAAEKLLFGDAFDTAEARRLGFVNRIAAPADVETVALAAAERLAGLPGDAVRATKALLRADPAESVGARLAREAQCFERLLATPAARAALAAFSGRPSADDGERASAGHENSAGEGSQ
ncbi:enoyl-CoA hydratase-related protein [Chitinasiproducens palmae]|uniref:Enoyl-CoA hydratase/carnithine racemase n=1 Tax=Chitinasiproducens palmae TaxID=1770053 RepID=A0A1H2PNA0_9BURK|nr:enoyl-CoA hydratase-related protein [Chitinasiproducens palmae]SDV48157.1 Enoyl-CoA hydratase/carnithine racemase [Chitinasiproducens palmae]